MVPAKLSAMERASLPSRAAVTARRRFALAKCRPREPATIGQTKNGDPHVAVTVRLDAPQQFAVKELRFSPALIL